MASGSVLLLLTRGGGVANRFSDMATHQKMRPTVPLTDWPVKCQLTPARVRKYGRRSTWLFARDISMLVIQRRTFTQITVQQQIILPSMPHNQRLSALEKALAVLEAVADQPQAVGLPDLAARLNLPRQTVHRVLGQLEEAGLVLRDLSRERYAIGARQTRLALSTLCSKNQPTQVKVVLQALVDELEETCNIGVLDGLDYVYLARIECKWPLRAHLEAGSRIGAHMVSGGKMLLSQLEPDKCKRLLKARKLEAGTSKTITRPAELEAELARIRARGYAMSNQEFLDGIVGVAVPIRDAGGRPLAALAVHGPVARLSLETCEAHLPRLRRAAERLTKAWISR